MKRFVVTSMLVADVLWCIASSGLRHFTTADGLLNNQVRQLVCLPCGQMFVATEGAFSLFDGGSFIVQECNLDSVLPLPVQGGHSYLLQGDSLLWLKDFYSLYLYDVRQRRFRYDYQRHASHPAVQRFMHEAGDSLTRAHVEALNPLRDRFYQLVEGTPLQNSWLQAYARDKQGGTWMGLQSDGIIYLSPHKPAARNVATGIDDAILRVAALGPTKLLLGGARGIYVYDVLEGRVVETLAEGGMNCADIAADRQGRYWLSTTTCLFCFDHGKVLTYSKENVPGFVHHFMRFVLPLEDRYLLCNLTHHLGYFWPETHKFVSLVERRPELEACRTIVAACVWDDPRKVMVCTQNGLLLLDTQTDSITRIAGIEQFKHYSHKYNCILRDRAGRTWIGTQNGLLMMQGADVKRYTPADGLSNACITSLVEDADGYVWVGTSCGINRVTVIADGVRILSLGESDGIPQAELEERGSCMLPDGTLYFTSRGRLYVLDTKEVDAGGTNMTVQLVGLKVAGREMTADLTPLQLNYKQNNIELRFSNLNYAAPERSRYRYRLIGSDSTWQMATGTAGVAEVRYNALPPGDYVFEVQATQNDGTWGPGIAKAFTIRPPLWLTWWAKILYFLVAATCTVTAITLYLRRRRERLERDNDERVNHLFELRDEARHQFAQAVTIEPQKIAVGQEEERLVEGMMKSISANMGNNDYTVDQLAADIAMSRASLYKKTQQMLGITPNDFIRGVRLKHAAHLLATTDMPILDISLAVGINTPRYFSIQFKKMFACTPTEYRTGHRDE